MIPIPELSFDTTESDIQPETHSRWSPEIVPGIPPQSPIASEEVEPERHRPTPGRRTGIQVVLKRGCEPGFAYGELLVRRYATAYTVIDHFLPDFRRFRVGEEREAFVKNHAEAEHCFVIELVSDTVSGPTYRIRPLYRGGYGVINLPWKSLTPDALKLNVTPDVQPLLTIVTGIHYQTMGQTQSAPRPLETREGNRRGDKHRPAQRRGRGINSWNAWHVEKE